MVVSGISRDTLRPYTPVGTNNSVSIDRAGLLAKRIEKQGIPASDIELRVISHDQSESTARAGKVSLIKSEDGRTRGLTSEHVVHAKKNGNAYVELEAINRVTGKSIGKFPARVFANKENQIDLAGIQIPNVLQSVLSGAVLPKAQGSPQETDPKYIQHANDSLQQMKELGQNSLHLRALREQLGLTDTQQDLVASKNNNEGPGKMAISQEQPENSLYFGVTPTSNNASPQAHDKGSSGGAVESINANGKRNFLGVVTAGLKDFGKKVVLALKATNPFVNRTINNLFAQFI